MTLTIVPQNGEDNTLSWKALVARAVLAMIVDWAALLRGLILIIALTGVVVCALPSMS